MHEQNSATVYNTLSAKESYNYKFFVLCHQLYEELDKTPFTLVETTEQLQELNQHLSAVREFAVDLEVHCVKCIEVSCCKIKNVTR